MKANRNYAILGATVSSDVAAVGIKGNFNANFRIACPGIAADNDFCQSYFANLSDYFGIGMIPVVNTGDAGNTTIDILNDETNRAPLVTLHMALLKK